MQMFFDCIQNAAVYWHGKGWESMLFIKNSVEISK